MSSDYITLPNWECMAMGICKYEDLFQQSSTILYLPNAWKGFGQLGEHGWSENKTHVFYNTVLSTRFPRRFFREWNINKQFFNLERLRGRDSGGKVDGLEYLKYVSIFLFFDMQYCLHRMNWPIVSVHLSVRLSVRLPTDVHLACNFLFIQGVVLIFGRVEHTGKNKRRGNEYKILSDDLRGDQILSLTLVFSLVIPHDPTVGVVFTNTSWYTSH